MPADVGDVVRATVIGSLGDSLVVNTWHFKLISPAGPHADFDVRASIDSLLDNYYVGFNGQVTTQVTFDRVDFQNITTNILMGSNVAASSWDGLSAQEGVPREIALYMYWRTNLPKVRAAKYVAGLTEGSKNFSAWSSALLNAAQSIANQFVGNLLGVGITWQYVAYNDDLARATPVTSAHVTPTTRMMRSRRPGYGS